GNNQRIATHGDLAIAPGGQTPADGGSGTNGTNILMLHFSVTETSGIENINLTSFTFALTGGGSPQGVPNTDITQVTVFLDDGDSTYEPGGGATDDPILGTGTVDGSDNAQVTLTGGHTILAGQSDSFYVAVDFSSAPLGATYTLRLDDTGVAGTGVTSALPPSVTGGPVSGRTVTIVPIGTLTVTTSGNNPSTPACVDRNTPDHLALAMNLAMDNSEGVNLTSMTLTATGDGNDQNDISSVDIYFDSNTDGVVNAPPDILLGTGTFSADNGTATINLTRNIAAGTNEDWIAVLTFNPSTIWVGLTFTINLMQGTDVMGTGTVTSAPVNVNVVGAPLRGGLLLIEGIWTQIMPGGGSPGARWGHTCVFDPNGNRLIMYAGIGGSFSAGVAPYNDTWALTLTPGSETWVQLLNSTQGPTNSMNNQIRWWHASAFDAANNHVIIYGGRELGTTWLTDLWYLDLSAATLQWTGPTTMPSGRMMISADHHISGTQMLFYGGVSGSPAVYNQDVISISCPGHNWSTLTPVNAPPPNRAAYGLSVDQAGTGRLILINGVDSTSVYRTSDAFDLATNTWSALGLTVALRWSFPSVVDPDGQMLFIYAGEDPANTSGPPLSLQTVNNIEAYDFTTSAWYSISTTGAVMPMERQFHAAIWDRPNKRMVVVFGTNDWFNGTAHVDIWELH
ncbi:MAG: Kelch repeat-containing protein, partial [Planctomycetota bacterium]